MKTPQQWAEEFTVQVRMMAEANEDDSLGMSEADIRLCCANIIQRAIDEALAAKGVG